MTTLGQHANNWLERLTGRKLLRPSQWANRAKLIKTLSGRAELSLRDARYLGSLVETSDQERPIIEIGTLFGWSTALICLFKHPRQPLITVDNYSWNPAGLDPDEHYAITNRQLSPLVSEENVTQVRGDKDAFYEEYDGPAPALFFCDADHSYEATLRDLRWAQSVEASVICGDDYTPNDPGVMKAVEDLGEEFTVIDRLFIIEPS